jgi:hypothetical protein
LNDDERIGKGVVAFLEGRQENEKMVAGSITHELEIVRRVLVVTSDVETHHPL